MSVDQIAHHVFGLLAGPLWLSALAALCAKGIWRGGLQRTSVVRLALQLLVVNAGVTLAGLVLFRHDGKLWTDAAMIVATAALLGRAIGRGASR